MKKLDRNRFRILSKLSGKSWILNKIDSVEALLMESEDSDEHELISALLERFRYLENDELGTGLREMARIIVEDLGLSEDNTQISAITFDDEADSSQKFLDFIKMPLAKKGWGSVKTVNSYGAIIKNYKKGLKNIVFIDEFIGSGQTLRGRIKQLKNDIKEDFSLSVLYFSGMKYAIDQILSEKVDIRCVYQLDRGITDIYEEPNANRYKAIMKNMEARLQQEIGNHHLDRYSLGFNQAESLYSLEACHGNTPNSVFPVFWWPRYANGELRPYLVQRFERGIS